MCTHPLCCLWLGWGHFSIDYPFVPYLLCLFGDIYFLTHKEMLEISL